MIRSTFASFTTAQLAMRASQNGLDITGQNISNINTTGYTRQNIDQVSLNTTNPNYYSNSNSYNIGYGVKVTGTSQTRDAYLDIRFRNQMSKVGTEDSKLNGLEDLESIFDETSATGLKTQIDTLASKLQTLSSHPGETEYDTLVRGAAQSLTNLFNSNAKEVETVRENHETELQDVTIRGLNDTLSKIVDLNKSIRIAEINGMSTLELQDSRNLLLDDLSSYMKIDVKYTDGGTKYADAMANIGRSVQDITITTTDSSGNVITLINNGDAAPTFSVEKDAATGNMNLTYTVSGDPDPKAFDPSEGTIKGELDFLNQSPDEGRGIQYYEKQMNDFAAALATKFNELNKGSDGTGFLLFTSGDAANPGSGITAANIQISADWLSGKTIIPSQTDNSDGSTANDNILSMIQLLERKDIQIGDGAKTSFLGFYDSLLTTLNEDISSGTSILENYVTVADSLATSRDNISAVSLDEEGINILQYQKSFNAAARMMTALDEALDTVINSMGVVGR